ncbi:hypothetical protein [Microbispora sp. KK1-11]|uniref:hypothetical protein n=1 Tax=Microbispora sp. KK1-11 TaxID=2053005 RepID=UPI0011593D09|nr:hypothetical protein [Microbispora sp. KK1-11]TQS31027.1 hypothetical protein FLW16_01735 [Microbispora sp. KK1-11]
MRTSRNSKARAVGGVIAALGLGAALLGAPAPAQASALSWAPGGCNKEAPTGSGFAASACVSYTSNSRRAYYHSDAYIDAKPSGCFQLKIEEFDWSGNRVATQDWQRFCGTGRYAGPTFEASASYGRLYSELTIVNGSKVYVINSPYIGYSFP